MKDFEFKAWDDDLKKMATVYAIDWNGGEKNQVITCHLEYEDGTIKKRYPDDEGYGNSIIFMMSSGLYDVNDKKIFEGDELYEPFTEKYYVVVFTEGCFYAVHDNISFKLSDINKASKVVGNVNRKRKDV